MFLIKNRSEFWAPEDSADFMGILNPGRPIGMVKCTHHAMWPCLMPVNHSQSVHQLVVYFFFGIN